VFLLLADWRLDSRVWMCLSFFEMVNLVFSIFWNLPLRDSGTVDMVDKKDSCCVLMGNVFQVGTCG